MKKYIVIFGAINLCILAVVAGLVFLEATYPFQPGDRLYGVQHTAEQARLHLTRDEAGQMDYALELADRRLADMAIAAGPLAVELGVEAFDQALNESVEHLAYASAQDRADMDLRFETFLTQADLVVASLPAGSDNLAITAISHRIGELLNPPANQGLQVMQSKEKPPLQIEAVSISFLGVDVDHEDFPLTGGHLDPACESCHADGLYKGTPAECSLCHPLTSSSYAKTVREDFQKNLSIYPEHFAGECSDCHSLENWIPTQFEHEGVLECNSCHIQDLPEVAAALRGESYMVMVSYKPENIRAIEAKQEHYPGECMLCHSDTTEWDVIVYDHEGASECESCHVGETPIGHYNGACTNCHAEVEDWQVVSVDHSEYPDCLTCHIRDNPLDHYAGVCSSCHNTEDWSMATFNHSGYSDCRSCHTRPTQHFTGQCSTCHEQADWEVTAYDHKGRTPDCKNCHSAPSDHFGGSCSTCHHTTNWKNTKLDHRASSECSDCHNADSGHYQGQCSNCHGTAQWASATFNHSGYFDCLTCHKPPSGHYTGLCSQCHTTQDWSKINFDHAGLVDCLSCHTADSGHYPGQCSNCHTVGNWRDINFDHTGLTDCSGCHTIDSHWPGECSNCHITGNWGDYTFDHSGYTNCKSCHNRPADHTARGQCSKCHTTDTWEVPETPTVVPELLVGKFIAVPTATPLAPLLRTKLPEGALPAPTPPSSR